MAENQGLLPNPDDYPRRRTIPATQSNIPQQFEDNIPPEEKRHDRKVFMTTIRVWFMCILMMAMLIFLQTCYFIAFRDSAVVVSGFTIGLAYAMPYIVNMKFATEIHDDYGAFYENRPPRHPQTYYKVIFCTALICAFSGGLCAGAYFSQWERNSGPVAKDISANKPPSEFGNKFPSVIHFNPGVTASQKYCMSNWFSSFQFRAVTRIDVCVSALVEDGQDMKNKPIHYFAVVESLKNCTYPTCFGEHGQPGCVGFVAHPSLTYPRIVVKNMAKKNNFTVAKDAIFLALVPENVDTHARIQQLFDHGWIAVLITMILWPLTVMLLLFAALKFGLVHSKLDFTWGLV